MVDIHYRYFEEGDEEQLADLFNRAFQMNGGGVIRTPRIVQWRYVQSPNFKPEQVQIAVDRENKKIVGSVYANMIETVPLNGRKYLFGDINDVACHPNYIKNNIARTLMENAIEFMKAEGCDFSLLTADYHGFPRKKLYLKLGYKDIDRSHVYLQFPQVMKLMKDLPLALSILPALMTNSYLPRMINRIRCKVNSYFKDISYEIINNDQHEKYMRAINKIMPKYYNGFVPYTKRRLEWARMSSPVNRFKPTYIFMKKRDEIVGGAVISHQNMYAFKFGVKLRLGTIHELYLDKSRFPDQRLLHLGYMYLLDKVLKAATRRSIPILIYQVNSRDISLRKAFSGMQFIGMMGGATMIKSLKEDVKLPKFKNPFFVPTYVSLGVP